MPILTQRIDIASHKYAARAHGTRVHIVPAMYTLLLSVIADDGNVRNKMLLTDFYQLT